MGRDAEVTTCGARGRCPPGRAAVRGAPGGKVTCEAQRGRGAFEDLKGPPLAARDRDYP